MDMDMIDGAYMDIEAIQAWVYGHGGIWLHGSTRMG